MKVRNLVIGFVLIAVMASCSSTKVVTDMDKGINFTAYKTYQLKPHENKSGEKSIVMNELNEKRIIASIENQLAASGMESSESPDAYLVYGVDVDIEKGYTTNSHYSGGPTYRYGRRGMYYGGSGFGSSSSTTTETQTMNGTISIALIDAETDELLWISYGTKEINPKNKKVEENINKAMVKIFENFPIENVSPELLSRK